MLTSTKDSLQRPLADLYRQSLALLADEYELTMAYGYWKSGTAEKEAAFTVFFRKNPFQGGFTLACGLRHVIDYVRDFRFDESDVAYLAELRGADDRPIFDAGFLDYLQKMRLECDIDAVPDGTVVFPQEPLVRVVGPIIQAQILESALLNIMNFQTLIATKAARIKVAAGDRPVIEFGLRRAQGVDGALSASLAAYVGGCSGTSNLLAGKLYGIPVKGTHAHSWVMSFDTEAEAFRAYAEAMPNNSVFLVDTYDTIEGVKHAIEAGRWLKDNGHRLLGIRLDSGDLAYLSIEARRLLDQAGFRQAAIIASNDLDEHIISSLHDQGAQIGVWGVGTKLVTGYDQPALGGVYKLTAVRRPGEAWQHKIKLSEQAVKINNPGILQVNRFMRDGLFVGDVIFDEQNPPKGPVVMVDPLDMTRRRRFDDSDHCTELLRPIFRSGNLVYQLPSLDETRSYAQTQLDGFHASIKRLLNPHEYPVGLEVRLHELKTKLILKERGFA
ncbi:MAG TPA: nicotinate phosphoribosyltransferase [Candidatus Obscuribacterales bacterium]